MKWQRRRRIGRGSVTNQSRPGPLLTAVIAVSLSQPTLCTRKNALCPATPSTVDETPSCPGTAPALKQVDARTLKPDQSLFLRGHQFNFFI